MLLNANDTVVAIAKEAARLDPLEQQILLTKLKVKRLKKKGTGVISDVSKGSRKATLTQINKWKHESRVKP
jgi:hypothetical protein